MCQGDFWHCQEFLASGGTPGSKGAFDKETDTRKQYGKIA
jgi:hypothetical protein